MIDDAGVYDVEENAEDTMVDKYLIFRIGTEEYGLEIRYVMDIIGIMKITELPDTPEFVKGVINLRGKVIPVIDIRIRFNMEMRKYDERTCIINVNIMDNTVGLIVDSVSEVMDIASEDVEPAPSVNKGSSSRFISGLGKSGDEVKILLDIDKLLHEEELEKLQDAVTE